MYDFAGYAESIDLYAIIDGVVLVAALAVLVMLFAYRRNIRVLLMVLSVALLEVLVMVLSSMSDHEILTVSRYVLHYAMLALIVMCCVVYQSDLKAIFQRISNPRGLPAFNDGSSSDDELRETTAEILSACQDMAKQDVGAIIIIDSNNSINDTVLGSGTMLNAELSAALLESIFNTHSGLNQRNELYCIFLKTAGLFQFANILGNRLHILGTAYLWRHNHIGLQRNYFI